MILKAVVKRFFNEKEVTSTLVMDALYSGCKALDYRSRNKKGKINGVDMEEAINPIVWVDKDAFVLAGDVLLLLERVVSETLPPYKDDKGPQNRTKVCAVVQRVWLCSWRAWAASYGLRKWAWSGEAFSNLKAPMESLMRGSCAVAGREFGRRFREGFGGAR